MKELRFENPLLDEEEDESLAIVIVGERTQKDGHRAKSEERFECMPRPPVAAIRELNSERIRIIDYVRYCLVPKDEARFDALLKDKDFAVDISVVRHIFEGLLEHYGGRPTQASSASGSGRSRTGDSSTDGSSSGASTSEA